MNKIQLITDSSCDIPRHEMEAAGVDVIPIPIQIDGRDYREGIDFTTEEFYQKLENCAEIPKTAQITPFEYLEHYRMAVQKGASELIVVCLNAKGSGIFSSACSAKQQFFGDHPEMCRTVRITVIDSKLYSIPYGYPVLQAAKAIADGVAADEIIDYLEDWFNRVEVYFAAFSFEYIKKSGRIGHSAAFVGQVLGLRPLISLIDGETAVVAKPRGNRPLFDTMLSLAKTRMADRSPYLFLKGTEPEVDQVLSKMYQKEFGYPASAVYPAGACVATNCGPRMVGVGFLGAYRNTSSIDR